MIKSILIGLILASLILVSGWVRLLLSFISISFGNNVPYLYFFLGIELGVGGLGKNITSYWTTYIAGMIFSLLILKLTLNYDNKSGKDSSTATLCGSGFICGGLIGMVVGLFI